jgi:ABC-2 type transport system ATP-binding protein
MNEETTPVMIEAAGLSKTYAGGHVAIEDISFECRKGEIVGFLGPNGAGKTTTMRILTGYMPATDGQAAIAGFDTMKQSMDARQRLGYLPETVPLYPEMSVEDYLAFVGKIRRLDNLWERIDDTLNAVGMLDRAESLISTLSKGMRQRVGLAQALLHDPDVLILDEPTIGLDPAQIREVRQLIIDLGKRHTILLSTHILSEVEQICSRVIMIIGGSVVADMPLGRDPSLDEAMLWLELHHPDAETVAALQSVPQVLDVAPEGESGFQLRVVDAVNARQAVARLAVSNNWGVLELATARTNLESLFMNKLREWEASSMAGLEPDDTADPREPDLDSAEDDTGLDLESTRGRIEEEE